MTAKTEPDAITEYRQQGWDLSALLPEAGDETLAAKLAEIDRQVRELETRRGELGPELPPERWLEMLRQYEGVIERMYVLVAYGSLWFSADTQSEAALTFRNRVEHALTGFQNRILFLTLWWKGLSDEQAERLLPGADEVDFRHFLLDLRRLKPYTLDEPSEKILNLKNANGIDAVLKLYSMLTSRLEFTIEEDGVPRVLTRDEVSGYAFSPRPELRRAAYDEFFRVYGNEAKVLAQMYVHRVRDWQTENQELRGYRSPIAVRNAHNDLPDAAVETLLDAVDEQVALFHRYFRLKAALLGDRRLSRYDLYAPLASSERRIGYGQAVRMVLETLYDFDTGFGGRAEKVFAQGHIDSAVRKGKRGGGFCATVLPEHTPWLLVNYTGRVRDVATLAHELGHAVHSMLAAEHSVLTQHASLPLAETSSVFAEMLLTERLLREEGDPLARRELLGAWLDDIYATVMRQAFFVRWEIEAHRAIDGGGSPEKLCDLFLGSLHRQFGDSVEVPAAFRWEWITIPHFYHSPFYCYAYSFGQLLVLSLYRRYQEQGESFVPGYLKLLAHGGSAPPLEILSESDVDVSDPAFWRGGFAVVADVLDEFEKL